MEKALIKNILFWIFFLICQNAAFALEPIEIHFMDVGHGDAILIKGPENQNVLVDIGNLSAGYRVRNYLKVQNVSSLSAVIITHMHPDHVGGVFVVLPDMNVAKVYDNGAEFPKSELWKEYMKLVNELGLRLESLRAGQRIHFGDLICRVLSPSNALSGNMNADSIVMRMSYGEISLLMMGDATEEVERELVKNREIELESQILKVGHHGGADATSLDFLHRVNPAIAVVSVERDSAFGHPAQEVIDRLKLGRTCLYRTDLDGTVVLGTDGKNLWGFQNE